MTRHIAVATLVAYCVCGASSISAGEAQDKAVKLVKERLTRLKAPEATVEVVKEDVGKVLPERTFVSVRFRLWPVAISPPAPLKSQNLFVIDKDGKLTHLTSSEELAKLFKSDVKVSGEKDNAPTNVARAWLRLAQEFVQDGFYKFKLDNKNIVIEKDHSKVTGRLEVVEEQGNKGYLAVTMDIDPARGKIEKITEENKVLRGIRPRCQATRLLDPDPVIRDICEQDLLVMGHNARAYLMEQRARATPALQRAIDRVWQRIVDEGR